MSGERAPMVMPQLGETVSEGTVTAWLVGVGAEVTPATAVLEVSTDKVDTEIPAPLSGVLDEIVVAAGETVDVGTVIAWIRTESSGAVPATPSPAAAPPVAAPAAPVAAPAPDPTAALASAPAPAAPTAPPAPGPAGAPVRPTLPAVAASSRPAPRATPLSPVVRRLAADHGIDIRRVNGTGRDGRVTRADVEAFVAASGRSATAPAAWAQPSSIAAPAPVPLRATGAGSVTVEVSYAGIDAIRGETPRGAFLATALVRCAAAAPTLSAGIGRLWVDGSPCPDPGRIRLRALGIAILDGRSAGGGSAGIVTDGAVTLRDRTDLPGRRIDLAPDAGAVAAITAHPVAQRIGVSMIPGRSEAQITLAPRGDLVADFDASVVPADQVAGLLSAVADLIEHGDWSAELTGW